MGEPRGKKSVMATAAQGPAAEEVATTATEVATTATTARGLLLVRRYAYEALHVVFGQKPSAQILAALLSAESLTTLEAIVPLAPPAYGKAVKAFALWGSHYLGSDPDEASEALRQLDIEYTRLFIGPAALAAPPWEMVYRTGRRELFQPGVATIRARYEQEGCLPAEHPRVSDDHLALELDFMRFLCEKEEMAIEEGDLAEAQRLETVQGSFVQESLMGWIPAYVADLKAAATGPYYRAAADMLLAFVAFDASLLQDASLSQGASLSQEG
ncbi:MAG: molecular chaperone TorD family protein [Coriobacteriaceae bacterium]|nr:molecular chaperone TorD family protein [Coriobacteriaceae bacterium]